MPAGLQFCVHAAERSRYVIPKEITGKFAEHLGWNIYNGMDAQILRNPTFADYPFATGEMSPDGVIKAEANETGSLRNCAGKRPASAGPSRA